VSTLNILARKSGEASLPYCKIGAKLKAFNQRDSLVSNIGLLRNRVKTTINY
jgi:hypothetical protein